MRARPLLLLLGFVLGLVLAWTHPSGLQHAPDHACQGGAHLAGGEGPTHHPAHGCAACDLLAAAHVAPEVAPAGVPCPSPLGRLAPRATSCPGFPLPLGFAPRGPPV